MVLLPGCQCCGEDNCGCMPPYPDFMDVECSFSSSTSSGVIQSTVSTYNGAIWGYVTPPDPPIVQYYNVSDDVNTAKLTASGATAYSNRTFRLTGNKEALNTGPNGCAANGVINYVFQDDEAKFPTIGGGLWVELQVSQQSPTYCTQERLCGLKWSLKFIGHGIEEKTKSHKNTLGYPQEDYTRTVDSRVFLSVAEPISLRCLSNNPTPNPVTLQPPTRTQQSGYQGCIESCNAPSSLILARGGLNTLYPGRGSDITRCVAPQSFSGTNGSVWPFQISCRNRYGVPKQPTGWNYPTPPERTQFIDGSGFDTVVNTMSGFTACGDLPDMVYYCVDYVFTIHSVKLWYGETAVDFPSKPVYGQAPSCHY